MAKALGSVFELSIRYLLLLHMSGNKPLTESRLCADDFICTYAADFGLATENLNGSSGYRYGEYASRCSMANEAIRYLVLHGLIKPNADANGFTYAITDAGIEYCSALNSAYADSYFQLAYTVIDHYACFTDAELVRHIWSKAASEGKEET